MGTVSRQESVLNSSMRHRELFLKMALLVCRICRPLVERFRSVTEAYASKLLKPRPVPIAFHVEPFLSRFSP
jgi:hypothetical protein